MPRLLAPIFFLVLARSACAIQIVVDYSYDSFFAANPTARASLEQAAADLSAALGPTLGAVNTDVFTGTNGSTTATADWSLNFTNPSTGAPVVLESFTSPADQFTIYVGMRALSGTTLGQGGPGGAGVELGGSGSPAQWNTAVANMQTASNAVMPRGGGPVIGTISGNIDFGTANPAYSLRYGAIIGNLWFDNDSDNVGGADTPSVLNDYWHFDLSLPVAAGKNDFYSVALHEMIHSLGFGVGQTWNSLHSGNNWLGAAAIAANGGTGTGLLTGGDHIVASKMSLRLSDGVAQEAAMDPTLTTGTRKYLTQLDAAFLQDLGYQVVPEPSSLALLAFGALLLRRRGR